MPLQILIVDDDPDITDIVATTLIADGYIVARAADLESAKRAATSLKPDLAILDVVMESHNTGHELCRWMRGEFDIPIIFLTARAAEIDAVVGPGRGRLPHQTIQPA